MKNLFLQFETNFMSTLHHGYSSTREYYIFVFVERNAVERAWSPLILRLVCDDIVVRKTILYKGWI